MKLVLFSLAELCSISEFFVGNIWKYFGLVSQNLSIFQKIIANIPIRLQHISFHWFLNTVSIIWQLKKNILFWLLRLGCRSIRWNWEICLDSTNVFQFFEQFFLSIIRCHFSRLKRFRIRNWTKPFKTFKSKKKIRNFYFRIIKKS